MTMTVVDCSSPPTAGPAKDAYRPAIGLAPARPPSPSRREPTRSHPRGQRRSHGPRGSWPSVRRGRVSPARRPRPHRAAFLTHAPLHLQRSAHPNSPPTIRQGRTTSWNSDIVTQPGALGHHPMGRMLRKPPVHDRASPPAPADELNSRATIRQGPGTVHAPRPRPWKRLRACGKSTSHGS